MPELQLHPAVKCFLQQLHPVVQCLLVILLLPLVVAFASIFDIFFGAPLLYYQLSILNRNSLYGKYAEEGIRLEGCVVRRLSKGVEGISSGGGEPMHAGVMYQSNETRYIKTLVVLPEMYTQATIELSLLPEYPRSAILYATVDRIDSDFLKQETKGKPVLLFGPFLWMALWNVVIACSLSSMLIAPIVVGLLVLQMSVVHWVAGNKMDRDFSLRSTLFGAKKVGRGGIPNHKDVSVANSDSFREFLQEGTHSVLFVIITVFRDFCFALGFMVTSVYVGVFGGGFVFMLSFVVAKWINQLLEMYESGSDVVSGSVLCLAHFGKTMIVECQVENQMYRKRLEIHYWQDIEHVIVGDCLELVYLKDIGATSACLKSRIDNLHQDANKLSNLKRTGMLLVMIQVTAVPAYVGIIMYTCDSNMSAELFLFVAGIYLACEIIFGFAGACLYYWFFFRQNLLYGGKNVCPTRQVYHDEDDARVDQKLYAAVLWSDTTDAATDVTEPTTDESTDPFLNKTL